MDVKDEVREAVLDARMQILGTNIYFGGFAARMRWAFSKRFPTAATDGKSIFLNPDFVARLLQEDVREVKGLVIHEIGHPALGHSLRKGHRVHKVWNIAADAALNKILQDEGFFLPKGAIIMPQYDGMSAEEIYADLMKNGTGDTSSGDEVLDPPFKIKGKASGKGKGKSKPKGRPKDKDEDKDEEADGDGTDGDADAEDRERSGKANGKPKDNGKPEDQPEDKAEPQDGSGSNDEKGEDEEPADEETPDGDWSEDLGEDDEDEVIIDPAAHQEGKEAGTLDPMSEWRLTVANLSAMSKRAGQMGGGLAAEIDAIKRSSVDWKTALANILESIDSNEDYAWSRPDRRLSGGDFLFPGEFSEKSKDLVVHLDTSGSCFSEAAQGEFLAHFNDLVRARNFRKIVMIHVDTSVCHVEEFDMADGIPSLDSKHRSYGGGGTCFAPSLVWLADHEEIEPAAIVYLTDMYGSFPEEAQVPAYPVIWLAVNGESLESNEKKLPDYMQAISTVIAVDTENL